MKIGLFIPCYIDAIYPKVGVADSDNPPVHLPLGKDTLQMFKEKMDKFNAEIESWKEVITGTDHEDVAMA